MGKKPHMVFDLISFLAGIIVGGLTGTLAGILTGFERTADIQEKLLRVSREMDRIDPKNPSSDRGDAEADASLRELRVELDSIQEEIRRMYRRTTR